MQLSYKKQTISQSFLSFLKFTSNSEHFEKKMTLIDDAFSKLGAPKDVVRKMSKMPGFRLPFNSQHAKRSQSMLKLSRPLSYHIFSSF